MVLAAFYVERDRWERIRHEAENGDGCAAKGSYTKDGGSGHLPFLPSSLNPL